jgi:ribosomal protein L2
MGRFFDQSKINSSVLLGSSVPLQNINLFSLVSNIELIPFGGGIVSRAAGTGLLLTSKIDNKVLLKSKSG